MQANLQPSRPAPFIPIAPKAKRRKCRYCPKMIYLSRHPSTKRMHPIAIDTDARSYAPADNRWGQGLSHYIDCPGADRARRDARAAAAKAQQELAL